MAQPQPPAVGLAPLLEEPQRREEHALGALPHDEVQKLADGSIFTGRQALKVKLIDQIGGNDEIRAYLETRKVSKNLPEVDWDKRRNTAFLLADSASHILTLLGYDDLAKARDLGGILPQKLLLDGLLSVWQVGND